MDRFIAKPALKQSPKLLSALAEPSTSCETTRASWFRWKGWHRGGRLSEPKFQPEDLWDSSYSDPVRGAHAGGPHPNQNIVAADRRSSELFQLEHPLRRPYLSWTMAFIVPT